MTQKIKIYTKTGDKGTTSLLGGTRVSKHDLRIALYGDIDELNSHLGYFITLLTSSKFLAEIELLTTIQSKLFSLGAYFSCESVAAAEKFKVEGVKNTDIEKLEKKMDELDNVLIPLKNFILPGGDQAAAYAHICRTVCRRVERGITHLFEQEKAQNNNQLEQLIYINRLSDFFFVLSRWLNFKMGAEEVLWTNKE